MKKKTGVTRPLEHRTLQSPIGPLALVASQRGLVAISFTPKQTISELKKNSLSKPSRPVGDPDIDVVSRILDETEQQLQEYFAGTRRWFALPLDYMPHLPSRQVEGMSSPGRPRPNPWISERAHFRTRAQIALITVPYGETRTYGQIAAHLGNPGAARAVGTACATNPIPIIVPCHRITRADGSWGRYSGGVEIKNWLIRFERGNK